jgi:hypothetical protein
MKVICAICGMNKEKWYGKGNGSCYEGKRHKLVKPIKTDKREQTIHAILAGLLLNGFIQGQTKEKIDDSVLDFAKRELNKII